MNYTIQEHIRIHSCICSILTILVNKGICTEEEIKDCIDMSTEAINEREDVKKALILDKMDKEILSDEEKDFFKSHLTPEELEQIGGNCDKYINAMQTFVKSKNEGKDFISALFKSLGSMF